MRIRRPQLESGSWNGSLFLMSVPSPYDEGIKKIKQAFFDSSSFWRWDFCKDVEFGFDRLQFSLFWIRPTWIRSVNLNTLALCVVPIWYCCSSRRKYYTPYSLEKHKSEYHGEECHSIICEHCSEVFKGERIPTSKYRYIFTVIFPFCSLFGVLPMSYQQIHIYSFYCNLFPFGSLLGIHYYEEELSSLVELGQEFLLRRQCRDSKPETTIQHADTLLLRFQENCSQNLEPWLTRCGSRIFHIFLSRFYLFKPNRDKFPTGP